MFFTCFLSKHVDFARIWLRVHPGQGASSACLQRLAQRGGHGAHGPHGGWMGMDGLENMGYL